jgi:hypothetical protein
MGGTSVAAPQAARSIADQLAGGGPPVLIALPQPERSGAGGIVTDPIVKLKRYEFP